MKSFLTILVIVCSWQVNAQVELTGQLMDERDQSPLGYASLQLVEEDTFSRTDENGQFSFVLSKKRDSVSLRVWVIGLDTTVRIATDRKPLLIKLKPHATQLGPAKVEGYTARGVVEQVINHIDSNYFKFSYGAAAFYRQYQKVNGDFANLVEAKAVTLFKRQLKGQIPEMQEAHAVGAVRKSPRRFLFEDYSSDEYYNLFEVIPVYNIKRGPLAPSRLDDYSFSFDSVAHSNKYVIQYHCDKYSTESHGVDNHGELHRYGEASEKGRLVIDKASFALLEFERKSIRNPYYQYPDNDNYLLPNKRYLLEFDSAYVKINFTLKGGQHVVNRILYHFTNEYRHAELYSVDYRVTEYFEWYAINFSKYVSEALLNKLTSKTELVGTNFPYKSSSWQEPLPEYQFADSRELEGDIRSLSKDNVVFKKK